jgi:predicted DNA binding CopG/RHH family protein
MGRQPAARSSSSKKSVGHMKKHYDFSKSARNPYLSKAQKPLTIRLDEDTIGYFKSVAEKNGIPYQNLINLYLRECAESGKQLTMTWS